MVINNQCRTQTYVTLLEELCVQLARDVLTSLELSVHLASGLVNCLYSLDFRTFPQI